MQCRGLWGIMEWLQTSGLEHTEAGFGWEGLAVQGRTCLARVLMLEGAQSGQKCVLGMMHLQVEENSDSIFHCFIFEGSD